MYVGLVICGELTHEMGLPSNATEMPPIFPCWTNTVNEFLKSASADTRPAPWQVTFGAVAILNEVELLRCGRTKSINEMIVPAE
jgi:hypothetical protein